MKCPKCDGRGKSSAYLGVISEEQVDDPDFMEDYLNGVYDRPCPTCHGTGDATSEDLEKSAQRRRDAYDRWNEDGRPGGSFSDWYGE